MLAGVLQNLGEVIIDRYPAAAKFDHAQLGATLLLRWGLPISVVEAVCSHHDPERIRADNTSSQLTPLIAVLASNQIIAEAPERCVEEFLMANGFGDSLVAWRQFADQTFSGT